MSKKPIYTATESSYRRLYSTYKKKAKYRNIPFSLTYDETKYLLLNNCHYCNVAPNTYSNPFVGCGLSVDRCKEAFVWYNGIDRVDNSRGYDPDNCVSCCAICNRMKMTLTLTDFKSQITKIYNNLQNFPQESQTT